MSITQSYLGASMFVHEAEARSLAEYLEILAGKRDGDGDMIPGFDMGILIDVYDRIIVSDPVSRTVQKTSEPVSFCYRGQASVDYELLPSVARKFEWGDETLSILDKEREMIQTAMYRFPEIFRRNLTPIELLARLQHHFLPTRLLDITDSPLVALYFACQPVGDLKHADDGEVFVFMREESSQITYPIENAIADSYRFINSAPKIHEKEGEADRLTPVVKFFRCVIEQPYFVEQRRMYEDAFGSEEQITKFMLGDVCGENTIFANAPVWDNRQLVQQSGYIVFPNRIVSRRVRKGDSSEEVEEYCFTDQIEPIDKENRDGRNVLRARIRVPARCKEGILRDLKISGICKETLFPDSADTVCGEIGENCKRKTAEAHKKDLANEDLMERLPFMSDGDGE